MTIRKYEDLKPDEKENADILKYYGEKIRDSFTEITKVRPKLKTITFIGEPVHAAEFYLECEVMGETHSLYFALLLQAIHADGYIHSRFEKLVKAYVDLFPKLDNSIEITYDDIPLTDMDHGDSE